MIFTVEDATGVEYGEVFIRTLKDMEELQKSFIDKWLKKGRPWDWKPTLIVDFERRSIIIYNDWIE